MRPSVDGVTSLELVMPLSVTMTAGALESGEERRLRAQNTTGNHIDVCLKREDDVINLLFSGYNCLVCTKADSYKCQLNRVMEESECSQCDTESQRSEKLDTSQHELPKCYEEQTLEFSQNEPLNSSLDERMEYCPDNAVEYCPDQIELCQNEIVRMSQDQMVENYHDEMIECCTDETVYSVDESVSCPQAVDENGEMTACSQGELDVGELPPEITASPELTEQTVTLKNEGESVVNEQPLGSIEVQNQSEGQRSVKKKQLMEVDGGEEGVVCMSRKAVRARLQRHTYSCRMCDYTGLYPASLSRHVAIKHKLSMTSYNKVCVAKETGDSHDEAENSQKIDGELDTKLDTGSTTVTEDVKNVKEDCVEGDDKCVGVESCVATSELPQKRGRKKKAEDANGRKRSSTIKSAESDVFMCSLCGKDLRKPLLYRDHLIKSHSKDPEFEKLLKQFEVSRVHAAKKVSRIKINCTICGQVFHGHRIFSHLKKWHSDRDDLSDIIHHTTSDYNRQRNAQRRASASKEPVACPQCGKTLQQSSLHFHLKFRCHANASRRRLWECSVCGFASVFADTYRDHMLSHPANKKDFVCDVCGQAYRTKAGVQMHCRTKHGQVTNKPLPVITCPECSKTFHSQSQYKRHMRVHSGESLFRCGECGRMLRDASTLRRHYRTQHLHQYPVHCPHCQRGFQRAAALQTHTCPPVTPEEAPQLETPQLVVLVDGGETEESVLQVIGNNVTLVAPEQLQLMGDIQSEVL